MLKLALNTNQSINLLTTVLSVLRFTDSDYLFGIFKLFLFSTVSMDLFTNWYITTGIVCRTGGGANLPVPYHLASFKNNN